MPSSGEYSFSFSHFIFEKTCSVSGFCIPIMYAFNLKSFFSTATRGVGLPIIFEDSDIDLNNSSCFTCPVK